MSIQAIRVKSHSGMTLFRCIRTRGDKFATADGAVDLLDLIAQLAESLLQAELELADGGPVVVFEAPGGAVLPVAARAILAERDAAEVRRAVVLAELAGIVMGEDAAA